MTAIEEERILDPAFDVFQNKPIDVTSEDKFIKDFYPIEPLGDNDSNIRFTVTSQGTYWVKWGEFVLHYDAHIVRQKPGTNTWIDLDKDDKIFPCNNAAHSFFRDVKTQCNLVAVDGGTGNYHHLAYINNTLQYNMTSKTTHMASQGYYIPSTTTDYTFVKGADHSAIKFDYNIRDWDDAENETNKGIMKQFEKSAWKSYQMPFKVDLFHQGKHLPPGFRLDIELFRNDPSFYLVVKAEKDAGSKYRVEFKNMRLSVDYVRPASEVGQHLERKRQQGDLILYQYNQLKCFRHTIPQNVGHWRFDNPFQNKQPKLVLMAFVDSDHFSKPGVRPFIFTSKHLRSISLRTGGREVGGKELDCEDVIGAYTRFNQAIKLFDSNEDCAIDLQQFKDYSFFAAFDCTNNERPDHLQSSINLTYSIDITFKDAASRIKPTDMYLFFTMDDKVVLRGDNHVMSGDMVQPEQVFPTQPIKRRRVMDA